jgi:hypothetical protein
VWHHDHHPLGSGMVGNERTNNSCPLSVKRGTGSRHIVF